MVQNVYLYGVGEGVCIFPILFQYDFYFYFSTPLSISELSRVKYLD